MTTDVYRAVVGDFYWLWVNGQEFFRSRDVAPGLRRGVGVLEVTVEAIEADGTVVETWVRIPKERQCPFRVPGKGWRLIRDDEAKNSSLYRRERRHEVRIMGGPPTYVERNSGEGRRLAGSQIPYGGDPEQSSTFFARFPGKSWKRTFSHGY